MQIFQPGPSQSKLRLMIYIHSECSVFLKENFHIIIIL